MIGNIGHLISGTNSIPGYYEITGCVPGVSLTLDRACASGIMTSGVFNIGGALSLGSGDDALFETAVAGNKFWIKNGSYSIDTTVNISAAGTSQKPIIIEGYNTTRGDTPTGTSRPTITSGTSTFMVGANWDLYNLIFTGTTSTQVLGLGLNSKIVNSKVSNTSGTANRFGILLTTDNLLLNCEFISTLGGAVRCTVNAQITIIGCYIHDSDIGLSLTGTGSSSHVAYNIFDNCTTQAIFINAANTAAHMFLGNTFYGAETPAGIGVQMISGVTDVRIINNIFYGFVTAVTHADTQTIGYDNFNNYYNNTTDVTNWTKGSNDLALNPQFVSAAAGDFRIGTNLRAAGIPSVFPGEITTGYTDIGAVQRKELLSTDPGIANVKTGTGYMINDVSLTGTYDGSDRHTDPGVANVRSGTAYKSNSTTNNRTGTCAVPTAANTKTGVSVDATTGTYDGSDRWTDPVEANVRSGTAYKANSTTNNKTGTLDLPSTTDVKTGVTYDGVSKTGSYDGSDRWTSPSAGDLRSGTQLKSNSTSLNLTGTLTVPSLANTKTGVAGDGGNGTYDGSDRWTAPNAGDLRSGTQLKNNSTSLNLTGTLVAPSLANTKIGVSGDGGTGTYDGSDRWTDPTEAFVKSGVGYKANSTSNNKTGTYKGSGFNTDPGEANVLVDTDYEILGVAKTGMLEVEAGEGGDPNAGILITQSTKQRPILVGHTNLDNEVPLPVPSATKQRPILKAQKKN